MGPVTQAQFLLQLGIERRAETLSKKATPAQAQSIIDAFERLTGVDDARHQMGQLFKVMAVTASRHARPAGIFRVNIDPMPPETPALTARNLNLPGLRHAFFTRERRRVPRRLRLAQWRASDRGRAAGSVAENRARMAARLGVAAESACWCRIRSIPRRRATVSNRGRGRATALRRRGDARGVARARRHRRRLRRCCFSPTCTPPSSAPATPAGKARSPASSRRPSRDGGARRAPRRRPCRARPGDRPDELRSRAGVLDALRRGATPILLALLLADAARDGHAIFDLPGFIASRVEALDAASFEDLGVDTYADEARVSATAAAFIAASRIMGGSSSAIALI